MLTAITGINWGDEGKGRMVDLISQEYDIVARYQGGNNAGHTVKNERGKFVLNLLPSGILRPNVVCVMGNGMVIDPHHLDGEINKLREQGISITPANLKISDRATITMPYHVEHYTSFGVRLAYGMISVRNPPKEKVWNFSHYQEIPDFFVLKLTIYWSMGFIVGILILCALQGFVML